MKTRVAFAPRHATVLHALLANAEKGGAAPRTSVLDVNEDATALRHDQLSVAATRASAGLRDAGVRPADRVLECMPTRPSFATAFLGAMLAGAVPSNVAPPMGF